MKSEKHYIVVKDDGPSDGMLCLGIFDDLDKAFGVVLRFIWDLEESYQDPGDEFTYTSPYMMESGGGYTIKVCYKYSNSEKEETRYYHILFGDES